MSRHVIVPNAKKKRGLRSPQPVVPAARVNVEKIARAVVQLLKIVTVPVEVGQVVGEIDGMPKAHELAIALEDSLHRTWAGQR